MAGKRVQKIIRLNGVRLSFPNLFKPDSMGNGDKPAFTAHFLLPPDHPDMETIKKAMQSVAKAKFGKQAKAVYVQLKKQDLLCLHDGDTKTDSDGKIMEGYEGNYYVSARSYVKPKLFDRDTSVELKESDGKLYGGCIVNASLAIWPQTGQYGKRINAQLRGVQFDSEGESFGGGGVASADEFESLEDEFDNDDVEDLEDDFGGDEDEFDDDIPF